MLFSAECNCMYAIFSMHFARIAGTLLVVNSWSLKSSNNWFGGQQGKLWVAYRNANTSLFANVGGVCLHPSPHPGPNLFDSVWVGLIYWHIICILFLLFLAPPIIFGIKQGPSRPFMCTKGQIFRHRYAAQLNPAVHDIFLLRRVLKILSKRNRQANALTYCCCCFHFSVLH